MEIAEAVKQISDQEKVLSRHSDNLRQSVARIVSTFGSPKECQECGNLEPFYHHHTYLMLDGGNIGVDKQEDAENTWGRRHGLRPGEVYDKTHPVVVIKHGETYPYTSLGEKIFLEETSPGERHSFTQKIKVSIAIVDSEQFAEDEGRPLRLRFRHGNLCVNVGTSYTYTSEHDIMPISDLSREHLQKLIASGRLPIFLQKVAESYAEKIGEIAEAASASKMTLAMLQDLKK